jgi:hypothetical protein
MKKNISTMMTAIAALCVSLHPAGASLLGMPLNLKAGIELRDVVAAAPACQFCTNDVLSGRLLVREC